MLRTSAPLIGTLGGRKNGRRVFSSHSKFRKLRTITVFTAVGVELELVNCKQASVVRVCGQVYHAFVR